MKAARKWRPSSFRETTEMPELSKFTLFVVAALVLLVTPGPAVLYIVTRSVDQGRRAGFVSALGVATGTLFHVAAAALGLSALLASSVLAFDAVKYAGAVYLVYLGVRKFIVSDQPAEDPSRTPASLQRVYIQGVLVNVLNPKTALFFLAFLPQFVSVSRGRIAIQILFLGLTFILLGICSDGTWAVVAGTVGMSLKRNLRFLRAQRYFSGSVYIGLGLAAAFSAPRRAG
jgi:threonine/homoserine/homoserine lactone efflux protein